MLEPDMAADQREHLAQLRQALTEAANKARHDFLCGLVDCDEPIVTHETTRAILDALWPLIVAAVDQARKDGREQAAQAIIDDCSHDDFHWGSFEPERCPFCQPRAALARGSVPVKEHETKGETP